MSNNLTFQLWFFILTLSTRIREVIAMAFEKQRIVGTKNAPKLVSVSPAAPDILEFRVQQGYIVGGTQIAYQPEEGETLESDDRIPEIT